MTQVFTSEHETVAKIGRWLGESEAGSVLSERMLLKIAGWLVTRRGVLGVWFDEIAPEHVRGEQLRQQQVSHYSDEDSILERLHLIEAERDLLNGYLHAMGSAYAAEYDPDEVAADRENDRLREERQDETAADRAPKVAS